MTEKKIFLLICVLMLPSVSLGCSFSPSYRSTPFLTVPSSGTEIKPSSPEIEVSKIKRGYDDRSHSSCSDAGVIELKVSDADVGYVLHLVKPEEHRYTIPDGLYGAVVEEDGNYIRFIWFDGSDNVQEPISIQLEVKAMSRNGILSDPVYIEIAHSGGNSLPNGIFLKGRKYINLEYKGKIEKKRPIEEEPYETYQIYEVSDEIF